VSEIVYCPRVPDRVSVCAIRDGQAGCLLTGKCASCDEHPADLLRELVPAYAEAADLLDNIRKAIEATHLGSNDCHGA